MNAKKSPVSSIPDEKIILQPNEIIKDDKEILNLKNEIVELKDFLLIKIIWKKKKKLKRKNY